MNQQQIFDAIHKAEVFSDEMDARAQANNARGALSRDWLRLSNFLAALAMELDNAAPGVLVRVQAYQTRVIKGENPVIDARAEGKQP